MCVLPSGRSKIAVVILAELSRRRRLPVGDGL